MTPEMSRCYSSGKTTSDPFPEKYDNPKSGSNAGYMGIKHVKVPLSRLVEIKLTPEKEQEFLKHQKEHQVHCRQCAKQSVTPM